MLALVARYTVREGREAEAVALLRAFTPLVRAEEGCREFLIHVDPDDPRRILLYEQYLDEAALAAHRETPHFKSLIEGQVLPLLETREREVYRLLS